MSQSRTRASIANEQTTENLLENACRKNRSILNLSHHGLSIIPVAISKATSLTTLLLNDNRLILPPDEICCLTGLVDLSIDNNNLTTLPSSIFTQLPQLLYLNISRNPLGVLSSQIGSLCRLRQLWINGTQLECLPPEIGELRNLHLLGAKQNHISALPSTFCKLSELRWLHLGENRLRELPGGFGRLAQLVTVILDANDFEYIPECLTEVPHLSSVSLRGCRVWKLPDDLVLGLSRLSKLDLRDTDIRTRPEHWKGLDHILIGRSLTVDHDVHYTGSFNIRRPYAQNSDDDGPENDDLTVNSHCDNNNAARLHDNKTLVAKSQFNTKEFIS